MRSKAKMKLSLLASTGVSLLAVASASISTFAWFQAQADVTITTSGASTTITVNKPDSYTFFAYKGNIESSWDKKGDSFGDDFVRIVDSSSLAIYTNFSNFVPGNRFVYCVKIEQAKGLKILLKKLISNDSTKQGLTHQRRSYVGEHLINVGWAIDIFEYEESVAHESNPSNSYLTMIGIDYATSAYPDRFNFTEPAYGTTDPLAASGEGSSPNKVITLSSDVKIYDNKTSTANYAKSTSDLDTTKDTYVFFSVLFSNHNSTYYQLVKGSTDSSPIYEYPTSEVTSNSSVYDVDLDRYYYKQTGGDSSCYADLKFAFSEIAVDITK